MGFSDKKIQKQTYRRRLRVRSRLKGNATKPRMCVVKSNAHVYIQLIDDVLGHTLAAVSSLDPWFREKNLRKSKEGAYQLGIAIGKLAQEKGIKALIFDRGVSKYHGILAAVKEGTREVGLEV